MKLVWVPRQEFIEARYERYLQKKKFLAATLPPKSYILSDLDKPIVEGGKPLRDCVICDCCNEDIAEEKFLMVENSRCYHKKCAIEFRILDKETTPVELPANVIVISDWLEKRSEKE